MPETRRTLVALLANMPAGISGAVSVQDVRDLLYSVEAVESTSNPGVTDDETAGHEIGRWWINTSSNQAWICVDNSTGAAVWIQGGTGVQATRVVGTANSLTGGGDLSSDRTLSLVGDAASPGANKVYGTDGVGSKGWKDDPAGGGSGDMLKSVYDTGDDGRVDNAEQLADGTNTVTAAQARSHIDSTANPHSVTAAQAGAPPTSRTISTQNSLQGGGDLSANRTLDLVNDSASPGANQVYGTNGAGVKGWKADPGGGGSPLTTKGDLYGFTTVDARIPVGSDGQVLKANSAQSAGVEWANEAGGGGGSVAGGGQLVKIAEQKLSSAAATIDFSSLTLTDYEYLELHYVIRSADATVDATLRMNNDSGANYDGVQTGRTAASAAINTSNDGAGKTYLAIGRPAGSGATAGDFSMGRLLIRNHNDADHSTIVSGLFFANRGATDADQRVEMIGGAWDNTAALTQLTLGLTTGNYEADSYAVLYGVLIKKPITLRASESLISATNPPLTKKETTTNGILYEVRQFDDTAEEDCQFSFRLPPNFAGSTIQVEVRWSPESASSGGVVWGVSALAVNDDDAIDQAFGTEALATADTATAAGDYLVTSLVTVTPANTPTAGDTVFINVARKVGEAGDTMTGDANLERIIVVA